MTDTLQVTTIEKKPLVAAIYARVSTESQERQATIASQIDEIKKRIQADNNSLNEENVFIDDGWSGELLERPSLDALRNAVKDQKFQVLYVYDLGRLSRDFLNQLILLDEIKKTEVKFISLHDINATNDGEVFTRNVMGLFHDREKKLPSVCGAVSCIRRETAIL